MFKIMIFELFLLEAITCTQFSGDYNVMMDNKSYQNDGDCKIEF